MKQTLSQFFGLTEIMLLVIGLPLSPLLILTGLTETALGIWVEFSALTYLYRITDRPENLLVRSF